MRIIQFKLRENGWKTDFPIWQLLNQIQATRTNKTAWNAAAFTMISVMNTEGRLALSLPATLPCQAGADSSGGGSSFQW
jgi:hypothetical protein